MRSWMSWWNSLMLPVASRVCTAWIHIYRCTRECWRSVILPVSLLHTRTWKTSVQSDDPLSVYRSNWVAWFFFFYFLSFLIQLESVQRCGRWTTSTSVCQVICFGLHKGNFFSQLSLPLCYWSTFFIIDLGICLQLAAWLGAPNPKKWLSTTRDEQGIQSLQSIVPAYICIAWRAGPGATTTTTMLICL